MGLEATSLNSGVLTLLRQGRVQDAQWLCESALADGQNATALELLAEIHAANHRPEQAVACLRRLVALRDTDAGAHRRLGNALLAQGGYAEALGSYRRSLVLEPGNARGHNNLGQALMKLGRRAAAIASFERALAINPDHAIAHNNLAIARYELGEFERAVSACQRALALEPTLAEAHVNCAHALVRLDRLPAAREHYERALALRPATAEALYGLGNVLLRLRRPGEALEKFERALELQPDHPGSLCNSASVLLELKQPQRALERCLRAIAVRADFADAYSNLGGALCQLYRHEEAVAACERALEIVPGHAVALCNLGTILLAYRQYREAEEYFDRALAREPELTDAHNRRAWALIMQKRHGEAVAAYGRLLEIDPAYRFARGALRGQRLACCDWRALDADAAGLIESVERGGLEIDPFTFLNLSDSPAAQLRCVRDYVAAMIPVDWQAPWQAPYPAHGRIRVAYLSADFHEHATAMLMAGVFEKHDRSRFETIAVSFGPREPGPMRERLEAAFDRFIDVRELADAQVVELLRSLQVDIAVDLKGYTGDSRPGVLARRAAPLQVSYLGYPGTLGLPQIDYILADRIVLPAEHRPHYAEQVAYLPDCYQANDDRRPIAGQAPTRSECGLPQAGFVFCCFNNNHKLMPGLFGLWMGLLRELPGSVLWLLEDNPEVAPNLRREALDRGVAPERLVFASRLPAAQHLARHRLADLFLDTLPYNAHTTASDALWAGVPVLTCLGNAFPGRVAASLLLAVGLPELVTGSPDEYRTRALELASDANRLQELRRRLARNCHTHPLFNTERFCRHLEAAYRAMWERQQQGLPPKDFDVPVLSGARPAPPDPVVMES